jgi:parallel beta helix pectate lyase-like protein
MSGSLTAPIEVTNLQATGPGSLAAAISAADVELTRASAPALITFAAQLTGSIVLGPSTFPRITDAIDIAGPGARRLTVDAADYNLYRPVFDDTADSTLEISGLAVDESGVYAKHASLTLISDGFYDSFGSAVKSSHGSLVMRGCTLAGNYGHAGGAVRIDEDRRAVISDSTISGNSAITAGGLYARDSDVSLTGSTVTGNYAGYTFPSGGTATDPLLGYGGGLVVNGGKLTLRDSIVAGNHQTPFVRHPHRDIFLVDGAHLQVEFSLIESDTTSLIGGLNRTDITGKDPDLGRLRNNGGELNTERPIADSPIINAGKAFGLKVDQRGLRRTVNYPDAKRRHGSDGTDIGAVELQLPNQHK